MFGFGGVVLQFVIGCDDYDCFGVRRIFSRNGESLRGQSGFDSGYVLELPYRDYGTREQTASEVFRRQQDALTKQIVRSDTAPKNVLHDGFFIVSSLSKKKGYQVA